MGYDVEIARAVADKLGLKPKFIEASRDAMLAAFDVGKADAVFNQASITEERKKKCDYSAPLHELILGDHRTRGQRRYQEF